MKRKKVTIEELEAILESNQKYEIQINSDGSITAEPKPEYVLKSEVIKQRAKDKQDIETAIFKIIVQCSLHPEIKNVFRKAIDKIYKEVKP